MDSTISLSPATLRAISARMVKVVMTFFFPSESVGVVWVVASVLLSPGGEVSRSIPVQLPSHSAKIMLEAIAQTLKGEGFVIYSSRSGDPVF